MGTNCGMTAHNMCHSIATVLYGIHIYFIVHSVGLYSTTPESTSEPVTTVKCSQIDVRRLKAQYTSTDETDWPVRYVKLALVKGEKVTRNDKNLEEVTRLTLQGQVDELLLKKESLNDLKDIFHYKNKPCPQVIVIMGGPGEY